jgi:hypothetical protein
MQAISRGTAFNLSFFIPQLPPEEGKEGIAARKAGDSQKVS